MPDRFLTLGNISYQKTNRRHEVRNDRIKPSCKSCKSCLKKSIKVLVSDMLPFTFLCIKDTIKDTVMYSIKDTKNRFLSIFDTILDIIAHSIIELYAI
ncbi:MAG: hypothetical protein IPO06_24690 [Leptospiraceae bacterium]|nr:hypothetical protein [Leptospiraceae bacterium]